MGWRSGGAAQNGGDDDVMLPADRHCVDASYGVFST